MDSSLTLLFTELLFWGGFLLASPLFFAFGKVVTTRVLNVMWPVTKVEFRQRHEDGTTSVTFIDLKDSTPLVQQIRRSKVNGK